MRVVVLAAMPQEIGPLLQIVGGMSLVEGAPFPAWKGRVARTELQVVQTGMGGERAGRAALCALGGPPVDLVISSGFAGSLCPEFRLGQPVWSREVIGLDGGGGDAPGGRFQLGKVAALTAFRRTYALRPARFLTVERIHSKADLVGRFAATPTVVEMESTAVAGVAREQGVPFLGLRTISDEWTEEIEWQPETVVNGEGVIVPGRVMWTLCRRPTLLRSLLRLRRNSVAAGHTLAHTLLALVGLPEERMRALLEELPCEHGHHSGMPRRFGVGSLFVDTVTKRP